MMLISDEMRRMNTEMHEAGIGYGGNGFRNAKDLDRFAREVIGAHSILDYGCGTGSLKKELVANFKWPEKRVLEYDPAVPGKDHEPKAVTLTACFDVMEHIEEEFVENVLNHIFKLSRWGVFFIIATRPANKSLPDGRNAHLLIWRPHQWFTLIEHVARKYQFHFWRCQYAWRKNGEPHDAKFWLVREGCFEREKGSR